MELILLSLVGEQPIPNLLPLWQSPRYAAAQFIATKTTRATADTIAWAVQHDRQLKHIRMLEHVMVEAYETRQARAQISQTIMKHIEQGREIHLNLTGGTKLMSLAALQAAFGTGAQLMYVSTEENQVFFLGPDGSEQRREPIEVKIDIAQYLAAHGLEMSEHHNFNPTRPGQPSAKTSQGALLEQMVYDLATQSGYFDDVRRDIYIRKQIKSEPVLNELDVVVTRNGRLAVCSCKTVVNPQRSTAILREAIYELSSISRREATGIYCGKVLVTDQERLTKSILERARTSGVRLVGGKQARQVAQVLLDATR